MITVKEAQKTALKKYKTYNMSEVELLITDAALRGKFCISEVGIIDDEVLEELEDTDFTVSGGMNALRQPVFVISWELEDFVV